MKSWLLATLLLFPSLAFATDRTASTCSAADIQTKVDLSASTGDTVIVPGTTCHYASGDTVIVAGKALTIRGAGSSQVIAVSSQAYNESAVTLSTGSKSFTAVTPATVGTPLSVTVGETLKILETGTEGNTMTGTLTSYNSGTRVLVMNITSTTGSCGSNATSNCKRWMVVRTPASVTHIINDSSSDTPLFDISESTAGHVELRDFEVFGGTGAAHVIYVTGVSSGRAIRVHDIRISENPTATAPPSGNRNMIFSTVNRGVYWNSSFTSSPFNTSEMAAISIVDNANFNSTSWSSVSNMGALDTTGEHALYVEASNFNAFGFGLGTDDNGRMSVRHVLMNNSGYGTHGADTETYGQRYFEFYGSTFLFDGYIDGTTFNMVAWFYVRGGTFSIYNNTVPAIASSDYSTRPDINMTVMNLQRNTGLAAACWSAGTSGGANYHAPRQVGFGYVTGLGKAPDGTGTATVQGAYVGDSEPGYIWGNNRTFSAQISDYGGGECTTPDSSVNYIVAGRDFVNDGTAKPGWTAYSYPHPLTTAALTTVASFTITPATIVQGTTANYTLAGTNTGWVNGYTNLEFFSGFGLTVNSTTCTTTTACTASVTAALFATATTSNVRMVTIEP